jgi:hypothetical protein
MHKHYLYIVNGVDFLLLDVLDTSFDAYSLRNELLQAKVIILHTLRDIVVVNSGLKTHTSKT